MYLSHNVRDEKTLLKIIKDEKLKAGYLTGNINEGDGIYLPEDQKFVFFSSIDNLNSKLEIIEIQGTSENELLTFEELNQLIQIGSKGIKNILDKQNEIIKSIDLN